MVAFANVPQHASLRQVLLLGEEPVRSAPTRTLAGELRRRGIATVFSHGVEHLDTRAWIDLVRRSDALVFVQYKRADLFLQRQMHLAKVLGCFIVRWWVGSDVLVNLSQPAVAQSSRELDEAVDLNIAVAEHLVAELQSIGIRSLFVPSITAPLPAAPPLTPGPLPRRVLVYLPTQRRPFYGQHAVTHAIEQHPDLHFVIVSDESHSLAHHANVTSHGWVDNLETIWPQVGALLRMTEHDGLPRMVLEALARGRYVIHGWPLDGCWLADSLADMHQHLERFKRTTGPHREGPAVAAALSNHAVERFLQTIAQHRQQARFGQRWHSLLTVMRQRSQIEARSAEGLSKPAWPPPSEGA